MKEAAAKLLRELPSVSALLSSPSVAELTCEFGEGIAKLELRALLDDVRSAIRAGRLDAAPGAEEVSSALRARLLRAASCEGRRAINGTGILLHTGLGRAPLCKEALEAVSGCGGYTILQASIETGKRSERDEKIEHMLVALTDCEAATVVNNNAAATMLILNTIAAGKEVVISRGQLIEIGGSFRMPEVMRQSSAILREVGATNRTHLRDYEDAISEKTGAIMHVHTSNYRVRGFSGTPAIDELCELGRRHGLPVIDDLGSGAIAPLDEFGLPNEPLVRHSVAAGADAICFSADKLICGPQAGIILGKREIVARIRKNPFARMFRVGKLTLAGLEATLVHFLNGDAYKRSIPFYRMLSRKLDELESQAMRVARELGDRAGMSASTADDLSYVGSGSIPDEGIPTRVVRLAHAKVSAEDLARRLRAGVPSVFGRIAEETLILDMRTVFPEEVDLLCDLLRRAVVGYAPLRWA